MCVPPASRVEIVCLQNGVIVFFARFPASPLAFTACPIDVFLILCCCLCVCLCLGGVHHLDPRWGRPPRASAKEGNGAQVGECTGRRASCALVWAMCSVRGVGCPVGCMCASDSVAGVFWARSACALHMFCLYERFLFTFDPQILSSPGSTAPTMTLPSLPGGPTGPRVRVHTAGFLRAACARPKRA